MLFAIIPEENTKDMNVVSVENEYGSKWCHMENLRVGSHKLKLKTIGIYSGCFHYVVETDGDEFIVQPDSLDLLQLALIRELDVWVEQIPEEDFYNVMIYSKYCK